MPESVPSRGGYRHNPVFDQAEVTKMAAAGIQRLTDMQLSDGGWGWFSGYGEYASPHTTALVVHGLQIARQNDVALSEGMLEKGVAWLTSYQDKQTRLLENKASEIKPYKTSADDLDALVFMVLADSGVRNDRMIGFLDRDRTHLSVYAKTTLGLGLERLGEKAKLAAVLQNISQYVVRDDENQTAYLKLPNEGYWWWWYGSEVETDAFYLKLLARTDPRGELAPRLVKYVLNNRKHGTYWNSTRDTAFCIEALADYLKASGEDRPDMTVSIALDGQARKEDQDHSDRSIYIRQYIRPRRKIARAGRAHGFVPEERQRPALLQRLPDQFHARRPDHPRRPGNQGRPQGLSTCQR